MNILVKDKSTLKVTFHSKTSTKYDGHCLRAHSYFPEELPLIHLAEPTEKCYRIKLKDGTSYYVTENEPIKINGHLYSRIQDYFERV